jgi:hypothetical protein
MNNQNKEAIKGLLEFLKKARSADQTKEARPGQLPTIKGYVNVSLGKLRSLLLLPQKHKAGDTWKRYTVGDCVSLFCDASNSLCSVLDIQTRQTVFGWDACLIKLKVSYAEAIDLLGLDQSSEEDIYEYGEYLKKEAKLKDNCVGYELFLKQQATLAEVIGIESKLDPRLIPDYTTVFTSFADNRVFHPITNWKKSYRKEYFPHESDLKASQINFLSALIRRTSGRSPFTDLVDTCRKEKKDVYLALAKKCGKGNLNRSEAKKYILKSLFNRSDNWIWKDEGYQKTLGILKKTNEWRDYHKREWEVFFSNESRFMNVEEIRRKFEKLYIRTWLTNMELGFMTLASRLLSKHKVKFITVHDCFAFRYKPTKIVKDTLDSLAEDFGCEFSHE